MSDLLTKSELRELYLTSKSLLSPRVSIRQGNKSYRDISLAFLDCKTAKITAAGCTVHFATKDYVSGEYGHSLDSREFDQSLGRERTTYNHVLIFIDVKISKRKNLRDKVFVGLESHGQLDMHCHSHEKTRKVLDVLRRRLSKRQ